MTRLAAGLALALAFTAGTAQAAVGLPAAGLFAMSGPVGGLPGAPTIHRVEYYCSPGFEPSYGGACVAVPARAEIELFVDQPIYGTEVTRRAVHHVRRHRHALRERF